MTLGPDAMAALERGLGRWAEPDAAARRALLEACVRSVAVCARDWVERACAFKAIDPESEVAAEEIASGPVVVLRQLRLLARAHHDLARGRPPGLPGPPRPAGAGLVEVPVFPCRGLADRLLFPGVRARVVARTPPLQGMPRRGDGVAVVLGAGNVTSLPVGDALTQLFVASRPVLLKLHPLHRELEPVLARALAPLVEAGVLRITTGGAELAAELVALPAVAHVHVTGSAATLPKVAAAARGKSLSCELGNVSPVIVAPGDYTAADLGYQAAHVATMIANNASFNCVAAQVLVTSRAWPQRRAFLAAVRRALAAIPPRPAWYPGAGERFRRFAGRAAPEEALPWTLLEDLDPEASPRLLDEECFVAVCAEVALDGPDFLTAAVDFANERLAGDLAATVIAPPRVRRAAELRRAVERLAYGTVGVNLWAALGYALVAPPWGAFDASHNTAERPRSGIGFTHDPFMLREPVRTVIEGPFRARPRPVWFAERRGVRDVMWALCDFYARPGALRLGRALVRGLRAR